MVGMDGNWSEELLANQTQEEHVYNPLMQLQFGTHKHRVISYKGLLSMGTSASLKYIFP